MNATATIIRTHAALAAVLFALAGCNSSDGKDGNGDMPGGAPSAGGAGATSASGASGGTPGSAGGVTGANGGTSSAAGGMPTGGGVTFTAGGAPSTGGVASTAGAGGLQGPGGRPGGGPGATGGTSPSGGAAGSTGGAGPGGAAGVGGCTPTRRACRPRRLGRHLPDCVDRVNQFRACMCLPPLKRWNDGEACATRMRLRPAQARTPASRRRSARRATLRTSAPAGLSNTQVVSGCLQQMFNEGPPPMTPCTEPATSSTGTSST